MNRGPLDGLEYIDAPAANDNAALREAASKGDLDAVNRLLEFRAVRDSIAALDNHALILAAKYGHLAVVNRLLEFPEVQANIAARNNNALIFAAQNGHLDVVERLLMVTPDCYTTIIKDVYPKVYDEIKERRNKERRNKVFITLTLKKWSPSTPGVFLPRDLTNLIFSFTFNHLFNQTKKLNPTKVEVEVEEVISAVARTSLQ